MDLPTDAASLHEHYTLDDFDFEQIRGRRRAHNKMGFALQLCALRYPGRLLASGETIPFEMLEFLADQIEIDADALAGYANGGDVFVLDMGKPRKIIDIALQMIHLSGHEVLNSATGQGDIAIEITGLRPGEKLYEELLINADSLVTTPHPKIMRAEETLLSPKEITDMMKELQVAIMTDDKAHLRKLIEKCFDGYHQQIEPGNIQPRPTVG